MIEIDFINHSKKNSFFQIPVIKFVLKLFNKGKKTVFPPKVQNVIKIRYINN